MCSLIHGHANPAIVAAVTEQLERGTAFTFATEAEVLYAEYMCGRSPSFEKIRFVNSGTEAVMSCLKAARAFTGRAKIAKVEGAYHGLYDYAEVSQTSNPTNWRDPDHPPSNPVSRGTPQAVLDDVVVFPFNRPEAAINILNEHAGELACVLIDPMPHRVGFMPATKEFIDAIRRWTTEDGSLLVFDEVITFRSEYEGAQSWFDGRPDLTALGKMIGGGLPVGGLAGRADVMEVLNPLAEKVLFPHSGTFSANPLVMAAGLTAMELFDREAVARLNALGERARLQITEAIAESGFPACVVGAGSLFRIHMIPTPPTTYREAYVTPERARLTKTLLDHAFEHGLMLINTCSGALSTTMTGREIDTLCEVLLDGFRTMKEML
jgi:glutamate-1-semialdehyde 2,1-aminomutase